MNVGLLYQWGRKDCFPGADGSTITQATGTNQNATTLDIYNSTGYKLEETVSGLQFIDITTQDVMQDNTSLIYSIKHPLTFIYCSNITPWDWFTTDILYQNNALWTDRTSKKSSYDPCPAGWCTPATHSWDDFLENTKYYIQGSHISQSTRDMTNGRLYETLAWYPSTGYRRSNTGSLAHVGYGGYVWSSTTNETYAAYLNFNIELITPNYEHNRSLSLSVRCVQE